MVRVDPYTADPYIREVTLRENLPLPSSPQSNMIDCERDPFFSLALRSNDDGVPSLEGHHAEWERERSDFWAAIRNPETIGCAVAA